MSGREVYYVGEVVDIADVSHVEVIKVTTYDKVVRVTPGEAVESVTDVL